jgi:NAD-dependent deacetylase
MTTQQALRRLSDRLGPSSSVTVLTGAGISAASGIPTFRGDDGLWEEYEPSELASPEGFREDPETVWQWYDERRQMIEEAEPNAGHEALAEWETRFDRVSIVTQNVDGLHEEAGNDSVIRLHGNIWEVACWENCMDSSDAWEDRTVPFESLPPTCSECGGLLRPNVVWFGESLDPAVLESAQRAIDCDLFFTIGTSAEVHPAAGFIDRAARQGAFTVEINPNTTSASNVVDLAVQAPAEEFLPALNQAVRS